MSNFLKIIPKRKFILFVGDFVLIFFSLFISFWLVRVYLTVPAAAFFWLFIFIPIVWVIVLFLNRAYHVERIGDFLYTTHVLLRSFLISWGILGFIFYLGKGIIPSLDFPRRVFVVDALLVLLLLYLWRAIYVQIISHPRFHKNILILGVRGAGKEIAEEIIIRPNSGYKILAFIDDTMDEKTVEVRRKNKIQNIRVLSSQDNIQKFIKDNGVDILIVADKKQETSFIISECQEQGLEIVSMHSLHEELTAKIPTKYVGNPDLNLNITRLNSRPKTLFERALNIIFGCLALAIASPFIPFVILVIKWNSPGPVLIHQKRVGKGGKEFTLLKFRTMIPDAEKLTGVARTKKNDPRVTKVGRILRKTHIDEIPQLINIIKGEMSWIGPRPERPEFVRDLTEQIPFYDERHLIKPGLTGWAQVKYRYGVSLEDTLEKLQYELYYIKHKSILFDLIIILKTVEVIITGRGAR